MRTSVLQCVEERLRTMVGQLIRLSKQVISLDQSLVGNLYLNPYAF